MTMLRTRTAGRNNGRNADEKARRDFTRRRFLQAALAAGSAAAVDPKFFFGADPAFAGPPLGPSDHILVLIEFEGGNDGLNMLIP